MTIKYTPEELVSEVMSNHIACGEISGVDAFIEIGQTKQSGFAVENGRLVIVRPEWLDDFTMCITNEHGVTDEVIGSAEDILQFLVSMTEDKNM